MTSPSTRAPLRGGLSIGSLPVASPVALAPLSGVTDAPFRRMVSRFGVGWTVSEMVPGDGLAAGDEEARLRAEGAGLSPHIVQIAGCEPRWMAEGARVAAAAGADAIDINMGCPAKRVTGGYAGSALMRDLDHAERLIAATVEAVDLPVTVKMRLGWDETLLNAPDLARRAEAAESCSSPFMAARASSSTRGGRLARHRGGQGGRPHPGRRQWRHRLSQ